MKKAAAAKSTGKAGRALGEGTGPSGGFLVPKGNTIVKKPRKPKKKK